MITIANRKSFLAFPSMLSLFFIRCPFAIRRFVVTVIVDAVNRSAFLAGTRPHISKEIFKLHPACADFYAAAAVVFIRFILWIQATVFHVLPSPVLGSFVSVRFSATAVCRHHFLTQTAARICQTICESALLDNFHVTAFALANPRAPASAICG